MAGELSDQNSVATDSKNLINSLEKNPFLKLKFFGLSMCHWQTGLLPHCPLDKSQSRIKKKKQKKNICLSIKSSCNWPF